MIVSDRLQMSAAVDDPETLALTTQDVDFDKMEQDIERFAQGPSVRAALEVGVDLVNYSSEIGGQLADTEGDSTEDDLSQVDPLTVLCQEIAVCNRALGRIESELCDF
jgi:hypothetical protein